MAKTTTAQLPFLLRFTLIIISLIGVFYILVVGKVILIPLAFGLVFAILLNPLVNYLVRFKMSRSLAIFSVVIGATLVLFSFIYFVSSKLAMFQEAIPEIREKFEELYEETIDYCSERFNISDKRMKKWEKSTKKEWENNSRDMLSQTFISIGGLLAVVLLIPVYIFMLLFYKPLLIEFFARLFHASTHEHVVDVLRQTKVLIQSYIVGLMLETGIVAVLNISALTLLGIQYAFLLGLLAALLNIIPYIGGLVAITLPIMIVMISKPPIYILFVIIAYMTVQFIDNNIIVPKVVGSRVQINALVSIIVVLIGGLVWGIPGMFLSLPITAILKVIFDRVEGLKPWGFLLGDNMPKIGSSFNLMYKPRKPLKDA